MIDDPLVFLSRPDSVVVTRAFAAARGLGLGSSLPVIVPTGRRTLTIRGLLEPQGAGRVYGSSLAVMDIFAAQRLLGRDGRFDRVDVILAVGTDPNAAAAGLKARLSSALAVERPAQRGEQIEAMLRAFQSMLSSMSAVALIVAVFIIYNSLATMVVERRREIGVLRALGVRRREILGLYLGEAVSAGGLGALLGCALGIGLSHVLVGTLTSQAANTFGLPLPAVGVGVAPLPLVVAIVAGVMAAALAGIVPAVTASRVPPLEALQRYTAPALRSSARWPFLAGLALASVVALCLVAEVRTGIVGFGFVANLGLETALVLLSVPSVLWAARTLRPAAVRMFGVSGWLAGESSLRLPVRTAATIAALGLGLSMSAAVTTVARSFEISIRDYLLTWTDRDLFVNSVTMERGLVNSPVTETLGAELRGVPGIRRVEAFRIIRYRYEGDTIAVAGVSLVGLAGKDAWISDNFALHYHKGIGDRVRLETPGGPRRFRITKVDRGYDSDRGTVAIAYPTFRRLWGDRLVNQFGVDLAPDADRAAVRADVLRRFGARYHVQVLEPRELRKQILDGVAHAFVFVWGIEGVTLVVVFLGIFDTVLAGVLARQREIGVLRALGSLRRQIAAAFALEGLLIGMLGAALGLAAGLTMALMWILVLFRDTLGFIVDVHVPALRLGLVVAVALALSAAAAAVPARRAARVRVAEALIHE
jgi:putative ABC transport system permease protein